MSPPRGVSPGAAARGSLLVDLLAALALALLAFQLAAGVGIVAVVALLTILALGLWMAGEAAIRRRLGRREALRRRGRIRASPNRSH